MPSMVMMFEICDYLKVSPKEFFEFTEKAEAWDDTDVTDEESLYYLKVMNRVNEKLLETGVAVG